MDDNVLPFEQKPHITFDTISSCIVVSTSTEACHETYICFRYQGREIGKVKATFDFKDCPERFHHTALQMIMQGAGTLICDNMVSMPEIDAEIEAQQLKERRERIRLAKRYEGIAGPLMPQHSWYRRLWQFLNKER